MTVDWSVLLNDDDDDMKSSEEEASSSSSSSEDFDFEIDDVWSRVLPDWGTHVRKRRRLGGAEDNQNNNEEAANLVRGKDPVVDVLEK